MFHLLVSLLLVEAVATVVRVGYLFSGYVDVDSCLLAGRIFIVDHSFW